MEAIGQEGALASTLQFLGPSARFEFTAINPTTFNLPTLTAEDIRTPVGFQFALGGDGVELTGLFFEALVVNAGEGARVASIEAAGGSFLFRGLEGNPAVPFTGETEGTGSIFFDQIEHGEGESVPEPAVLLGSALALMVGSWANQKP